MDTTPLGIPRANDILAPASVFIEQTDELTFSYDILTEFEKFIRDLKLVNYCISVFHCIYYIYTIYNILFTGLIKYSSPKECFYSLRIVLPTNDYHRLILVNWTLTHIVLHIILLYIYI